MNKQKPLNVKLFNRIIRFIDKDVRRLYMPNGGLKRGSLFAKDAGLEKDDFASCGSACCFGGWSYALSVKHPKFSKYGSLQVNLPREAKRLGLSGNGFSDACSLFAAVDGSPSDQWRVVKDRLRRLIADRVANGEASAAKIKVPD